MLPYFVLGVALLAGLLLAARWFASADPKALAKSLKWIFLGLVLAVIVFFAVTGRLVWAFMAIPVLLPWLLRFRAVARTARNFSRMAASMGGGAGAATGQTSEVETQYLRVVLDHDSGAMSGEVIAGSYTGRRIEGMGVDELIDLLVQCQSQDEQSAQVLAAYLERVHPDWRERAAAGGGGNGGAFRETAMSRDEAYQILGLEPGAVDADIKEAYHRLMAGLHPDRGGSTYLAAKINQAKEVLLNNG